MIKLLFILSLILSGCSQRIDLRPEPYLSAEALLQQGIEAHQQDDFLTAARNFKQALTLYQSIANDEGIHISRLNLSASFLAVSEFDKAKQQLKSLNQSQNLGLLNKKQQKKLRLLWVKGYFLQHDYVNAMQQLKPLLNIKNPSLSLLATAARIEVLASPLHAVIWLPQFQAKLNAQENPLAKYHALLQRSLAVIAVKKGDYAQAKKLVNQALSYYKQQAKRRPIASCLETLAEIELKQHNGRAAKSYFKKSLRIRLWLKDGYKSNALQIKLAM